MSWTDERVETLKRMWAEGQSASQIAKELGGVTRNAVIGKVHRLGLSNRNDEAPEAAAPAAPEAKPAPAAAAPKPAPAAPGRAAYRIAPCPAGPPAGIGLELLGGLRRSRSTAVPAILHRFCGQLPEHLRPSRVPTGLAAVPAK